MNLIKDIKVLSTDPITGYIRYKAEYANGNSAIATYPGTYSEFQKYKNNLLFMYNKELRCR